MEMVERYIYAVTQKLPPAQREDIAVELRGLIEDMLDERVQDEDVTDGDVEAVLLELGDPKFLAAKYRGTKRYLISPEFYDSYISVLMIVLISIGIAMSISFAIEVIIEPVGILDHFVDFIVSVILAIPQGFGWVTIVFAIIDHAGVKSEDINKKGSKWKPSNLPEIPDRKRQIKRSEPIGGIIFLVLVMVLFAFSSNYIGVFRFHDGGFTIVPFLNEETFSSYFPFIILVLGLGILKECLKLISGKWTVKLVVYNTLINVVTFVLVLVMIAGPEFWNPDFMTELTQSGIVTEHSEEFETISNIWEWVTSSILYILIIGLIWDALSGLFKVYRH
ncbi:hypothetical protein F3157_19855 [Virgibacillus dakarensis]|uniref:HAAS signaling domain-containing protein n=1 Tax=Virgibacillus dakarensis TaxID=1917889 RepID=UPI000B44DFE3|nr:hypothetical protein [Virgibacillus dakarensis]MBT2216983.1 hypothetical protein [Virgibacillus dakarensis]MTW87875.1 hypothetical protein [Virgibacillus dakarensis]